MKKLPKDRKPRAKFKGCTREQFLGHCVKNNNGLGYLYIVKYTDIIQIQKLVKMKVKGG